MALMKIKYEFGGDDYDAGEEFIFEPSTYDLYQALTKILKRELYEAMGNSRGVSATDGEKETIKFISAYIINQLDVADAFCDQFEDELKEYFEEKAEEEWREEQ